MKLRSALALLCFSLLPTSGTHAAEVFKANATGTLNLGTCWDGGIAPGSGDVAVWHTLASSTTNQQLGANLQWAGLKVISPGLDYTVRPSSGFSLTLGSAGVDMSNATRNFTFNSTLNLGTNQTWTIAAGRTFTAGVLSGSAGFTLTKTGDGILSLTGAAANFAGGLELSGGTVQAANASGTQELSGPLSGAGTLNKTGVGTLTLAGDNTGFTGTIGLAAGQLNLNHPAALGGGLLAITGGSLGNPTGGSLTLAAGEQNWNGDFAFVGPADLNLGASAVTVTGSRTLTVNSGALIVSGILGGSGGLTKAGTGPLRVVAGAAIDLTGKLAVSGGLLKIEGGAAACEAAFEVGGTGLLELNGGVLTVPAVTGLGGSSTWRFNGGVLRAGGGSTAFMGGITNATVGAGGALIEPNGNTVSIAQALAHDADLGAVADGGLLVRSEAGGTVKLTGASTFSGPTVIESATLDLGAGGSLNASPVIEVAAAGALDGGPAGAILASGQTLLGVGAVFGKLTLGPGATLAPGDSRFAPEYGTLRMPGTLVLKGNAEFQIRKGGLAIDTITELDKVTYGGSLTITAPPGTFFVPGDSFKLFDAVEYAGSFASLNLPTLPSGLYWESASLVSDGTLVVINTLPMPTFNPPAGGYLGAQSVTISGLSGSTIHYTTDGSDPLTSPTMITAASPVAGIAIPDNSKDFTIKAYVTVAGANSSGVATAVYTTLTHPTWNSVSGGNWSDPLNWQGGVVGGGSGGTADFSTLTLAAATTATLDIAQTIGSLKFGDTGDTFNWTLGGSSTLTLDGAGSIPVIRVENQTTTINPPLAGSQGLVKVGQGRLVLTNNCPFTGNTVVNAGVLQLGRTNYSFNNSQLVGTLTVNAPGSLHLTDLAFGWGGGLTALNLNGSTVTGTGGFGTFGIVYNLRGATMNSSARLDFANSSGQATVVNSLASSAISTINLTHAEGMMIRTEYGGVATFNVEAGSVPSGIDLQVNNRIVPVSSGGAMVKNGAGTLALASGTSTYSGGTTVVAGRLLLNNPSGSATGSGAVAVNAGATLGGAGTASGAVTISAGAFLVPGANGAGTLSTGALTLAGTYQCQLDGGTADRIAVTGNLTLTGAALTVSNLSTPTAGTYLIATFTGTRTGEFASVPTGYTVDYSIANQVNLSVPATSGYAGWVAGFGLTGATALPTADPDMDGLANSVEFVLGGNPATVMNAALLPTISLVTNPGGGIPDGSYLKFTYRRTPASAYLNPGMESDADLTGTWTAATGAPGVVQVVTPSFFTTPTPADKVDVYVPRAANQVNGKLFGRLRVAVP